MNRIISLIALLLVCWTMSAQNVSIDGIIVTGDPSRGTQAPVNLGTKDYQEVVYLSRVEGNQVFLTDTAVVDKKGHFRINTSVTQPTLHLLKFKGKEYSTIHLMLEAGDEIAIEMKDHADKSFIEITSAKGSRNIEVYRQFNNILHHYSTLLNALNEEHSLSTTSAARKQELSAQFQRLVAQQNVEVSNLLQQNSDVLVSSFLVTFFDEDAENHIGLYETIYNSLKPKYMNNQFVQYLEGKLKSTIGPGRMAPDIEMKDPDGKTRKLSDLRGKVVMIDFWASWCSPCRAENPNVVRLYKKYHDKGFDIYSVSLDRTRDAWVRAIQQDGLEWPNHVSDLRGWTSSGGATYGIRSVPSTVLVDRDGRIIARNLRGQELANKLKEIFGE